MTQQEILNSNMNKTQKGKRLFELGLTRKEVAHLLNINYGFAQNIYKQVYPERVRSRQHLLQTIGEVYRLENFEFNHKFGIEIEGYNLSSDTLRRELTRAGMNVESYNYNAYNYWKITSDCTIKGRCSFELVSPILQGNDGLSQLKTATHVLTNNFAKVNKTCGLHIHFDAEGFDLDTWKRLYINYAKIEKIIDSFMPNSRRNDNNNFCQSMRINNYENLINNSNSLEEIEANITGRDRYYKLNSQAYWRHKSVEFRQHSGTMNFDKMENWILFLARLIEYSKHSILEANNWEDCKVFLPANILYFLQSRAERLR